MTKKTSPAYRASKEETIPINKLHPFSNHPFHIRHDLEFSELVDSISESGIITPIIVRPKVGVGYEVISGHRRWEACKELGIESIPARVEYIDDDEATILMVNSNIQREHVLPSEKAFAYKMRMEALKHQGRTTLAQVGPKFSSEKIAAETGDSRNQVKRYIRLTYLIPSILQMVDDGRIAFNPAVEISYMTEEHQTCPYIIFYFVVPILILVSGLVFKNCLKQSFYGMRSAIDMVEILFDCSLSTRERTSLSIGVRICANELNAFSDCAWSIVYWVISVAIFLARLYFYGHNPAVVSRV